MSQRQQLERLMFIDREIRAGRYPTAASIAARLEVSQRVVFKDREFMIDRLGASINFDRARGGWVYTDPTWVLPAIHATEGELLAFFLSVEVAQRYLGTAFEAPLQAAVNRILISLGDRVPVSLERLSEHYTFAAPATPEVDAGKLADLYGAIRDRRQVRMRYFTASRSEWSERLVHPHHLYNTRGDWYLFAYDHMRTEVRNFHLGRIDWLRVLTTGFEPEPSFSAAEHMRNAFQHERGEPQTVAIRFDAQQAPYIRERRWHATQQPVEDLADGGLVLRFEAGGLGEVKRWLMGFGAHAEVLEPPALRAMVAGEAEAMRGLYRNPDRVHTRRSDELH